MVRLLNFRTAVWASLGLLAVQLTAQSSLPMDSAKAELVRLRAAMTTADSSNQLDAAYMARMQLAPLVKGKEAVILLQKAASLADSLGRPDLGASAHAALGARFAGMGNHAAAYAETLLADSLEREVHVRENAHQLDELDRLAAERDSIARAGLDREQRMAMALVEVQRNADQWMKVALAAMITGPLLLLLLLFRMGTRNRRTAATIQDLRKEVDALKEQSASKNRAERVVPEVQMEQRAVPVTAPPVEQQMKPVVEGMFRKAGPERLRTLQEARRSGDHEKVVRVVASLKPQLLAFDPQRFAPLITRLKAPGAAMDRSQWTADLDALEQGLMQLLDGLPGQ
ncbi:MAG: hypothetical protein KJZ58_00250 [Flavobacteriales bacterium]|nr:hypothetical protein [Flavobacteriales bacterium]